MAIITNLRKWRNGDIINARDYVYERDLIVSLVNQHEVDLAELNNIIAVTGSENGIFEKVQFNISSEQDMEEIPNGSVFYNPDKRTLAYKCEFGHVHNINQEVQEIGKNNEAANVTLPAGTIVTWAGAQGANKLFTRADASDPNKSKMVGVLHHPAAKNAFAPVAVFAEIEVDDFRVLMDSGTDAGLSEGTKLYLSYTTPGKYTLTPPPRPYADIWVASVVSVNLSSHKGKIFVYPQNQRVEGGVWIEVSENQPTGQTDGDFWYDVQ
jgi:hypothetical protein